MQVLQMRFIGCPMLLPTAENSIGLIEQLFLPVLNLILVDVQLLCELRQCLVSLNCHQSDLGFESWQMGSSFMSYNLLLW